jgi:guanylate kinase
MSNRAPVIVVAGPSGVGKTTVVDQVLATSPLPLRRAITATSRAPRTGEIPGEHYHFWTPEQFQKAIANQEMLEYAIVHGRDYYGTPKSEVIPYQQQGQGVVLVIDVQGAEQLRKQQFPGLTTVFITVSGLDTLRARLTQRGESPESMARRLATAERELARVSEFDRVITNDQLDQAVADLHSLIRDCFDDPGGAPCSKI